MNGKKGLFVLLFVLVCLLTVGCGKTDDDDEKSSKKSDSTSEKTEKKEKSKKNEKTIECETSDGNTSLTISLVQDMKTYDFTSGKIAGKVDISDYKDSVEDSYWESAYCESIENELPYEKCSAKVSGKYLKIDLELDIDKYVRHLKESGEIEDLDENTLKDLKKSAEKDGGSCTIS